MPAHTKSKSHGGATADSKPKTKSPAAGGAEKTRSAVTGRQLGRAAIRSLNKNADAAAEYLDSVLSASSLADLQRLVAGATFLAVVERQAGAGRLLVTLQNAPSRAADHQVNLPIKGVLKFKGRANTDAKKERGNTMQVGDFVIVDGAQAASRLTFAQADRCRRKFDTLSLPLPSGFFSSLSAAHGEDDEEEEGGFAFDRSEEESAEAAAEEERKADEARRRIVKAGGAGRGGAPRVSLHDARAALAEREEGEAGADREDTEEEVDGVAAAAADGAEKPKPTGPNRAERRAAALAAAEAAAAAAPVVEDSGFGLYGDDEDAYTAAPLPAFHANKGWEELASDEIDIDAI
jgi:hypothetical protein